MSFKLLYNNRILLVILFIIGSSSYIFGQGTYLDRFEDREYDNTNGSINWASSPWIETNDDGNPANGRIRITNAGEELRFTRIRTEFIERTADISGATSVRLSFDWRTSSLDVGEDLTVEVFGDNILLTTITISGTTTNTSGTRTYDIAPPTVIPNDLRVRFSNTGTNWNQGGNNANSDRVFIDNFQIETFVSAPVAAITATGDQVYCPGTTLPVVETVDVIGSGTGSVDEVSIQISSGYVPGEDTLSLVGSFPGITIDPFNVVEGLLRLRGPAPVSVFNNAISAVMYSSNAANPTGTRIFSITIGDARFLPSTGHYYLFVPQLNISWTAARAAADASTFFGLQGYLATLTSQVEADFSGVQANGVGWIGASDAVSEGASEGDWQWVTGPEAGISFWNGGVNGTVVPPFNFAFWHTGNEPNNVGGVEHYAHITNDNIGGLGEWNDLPNVGPTSGDFQPQGYVVEYGGLAGDPAVVLSATTTITIADPLTVSIGPNQEICQTETATLTATPSGGSGTYTYLWSTGATTQTINVTPAGDSTMDVIINYDVEITDTVTNCTNTDTVEVRVESNPTATVSKTDSTCGLNNGTLTFTFPDHPNRTNIQFSFATPVSYQASVLDDSGSVTYSGLAPGIYQLQARWGNTECPISLGSQTILQTPVVNITTQPVNQTVLINSSPVFMVAATNADTYQWQVSTNGGTSFSNIADGVDYTGTETTNLTVNSVQLTQNGHQFRVLVSNSATSLCPNVISDIARLFVRVGSVITNRKITYRVRK